MLKIYLDWNCITHSKDRFPYILEIAEECANRFIFPYSNAHIRDLLVSRKSNNGYYQQDLELLTRICGKHFLHFDKNVMQPMFGLPKDYIDKDLDLVIQFLSDPLAPVPCPMMQIAVGDNCKQTIEKLMRSTALD